MAKRGFLEGYETYEPETEGYGSEWQWRAGFRQRMGLDEAREVLRDDSPFSILELSEGAAWNQIKTAYRRLALKFHPDHARTNGIEEEYATEQMKRINAAYTLLEARRGRG